MKSKKAKPEAHEGRISPFEAERIPVRTLRFIEAVAEPKRRDIFMLLASLGRVRLVELAGALNVSTNLLSYHISMLKRAGLVWRTTTIEEDAPYWYEITPFGRKMWDFVRSLEERSPIVMVRKPHTHVALEFTSLVRIDASPLIVAAMSGTEKGESDSRHDPEYDETDGPLFQIA